MMSPYFFYVLAAYSVTGFSLLILSIILILDYKSCLREEEELSQIDGSFDHSAKKDMM